MTRYTSPQLIASKNGFIESTGLAKTAQNSARKADFSRLITLDKTITILVKVVQEQKPFLALRTQDAAVFLCNSAYNLALHSTFSQSFSSYMIILRNGKLHRNV